MSGRALVIGGSLGGLFAANLLWRAGWDVTVFERTPGHLAGRGAGLVSHPPLVAALVRAGAVDGAPLGVTVPGRVTFARDGSVLGEHPAPQVLTSWSRLYSLLTTALPEGRVRRGWTLAAVRQDARSVTAEFADGTAVTGDLLIGADGVRSVVRGLFLPGVRTEYAGYIAWRGVVDEGALPVATHRALFERFAFSLPDGEQMLGYPIAGEDDDTRPGRRRYNFVWYRPADPVALAAMQTDGSGHLHSHGIPPGLIRPSFVAAMRADADHVLAPQFADVVRACATPFFQPIQDLTVPQMAWGRVALLGDAAFVARPHVGMGVTKAAQDAMALTDAVLAAPGRVPDALAAYAGVRQPAGAAVVTRARALGAYMQAPRHPAQAPADASQHRTPSAVMRETAWMV